MKRLVVVTVAALALVLAALNVRVVLAQHAGHGGSSSMPDMPEARHMGHSGTARGHIVEADKGSITVRTQQKGGAGQETFQIVDKTKIKGDMQKGSEVVVNYDDRAGVKVATSVEVKKGKQSKKS
jgi:hypothetical protein